MAKEEQRRKEYTQKGKHPFNNETCDGCHGSGMNGGNTCSSCNGTGII